ncbi:MAG: nicotinate (nicotinamide) nucleotide adenylyltransferase [Bacteroidales bacterium]|nr:nicotinate (nicotinamide) nucleotide adenylyltransferase [Bacteroidales bacterium]
MRKVAVYSGSFNPLHKGHLAVVRHLLEKMDFDAVRLIVSPHNPLKENADPASARKRFEDARSAAGKYPQLAIIVDDIELGMEAPQYTCRTLDALRAAHPDEVHTLVVGADQIEDFRRWRDYSRILLDYGIVAFPRSGYAFASAAQSLKAENPAYRITLANFDVVDISSTDIRSGAVSRETAQW